MGRRHTESDERYGVEPLPTFCLLLTRLHGMITSPHGLPHTLPASVSLGKGNRVADAAGLSVFQGKKAVYGDQGCAGFLTRCKGDHGCRQRFDG